MPNLNETTIILLSAILAFLASIAAIIVSAYNARLQRATLERWWGKKADAYAHIIDALSDMIEYYRRTLEAEEEGGSLSESLKEQLTKQWFEAMHKVNKATNMGAFLISAKAAKVLKHLRESEKVSPDWYEDYSRNYNQTKICLEELIKHAKEDLHT